MSTDAQEAPQEETPQSAEIDLDAIVAKHLGDEAPAEEPTQEEEAPTEEAATEAEPEQETPSEEPEQPEGEQPDLSARQLAVLARKEQELREKEQKLKEQEGKLSQLENLQQQFRADPEKFLKDVIGVENPADVATQLLYRELGDDAPEDFKKKMAEQSLDARLRQMEERLEKTQEEAQTAAQRAQWEAKVQAVDEGIQGFLKSVPEDMRFLQHESQENPEETKQAIYSLAKIHIENGQFPTAQQLAKELEDSMQAEYQRLAKVYGEKPASEPKKQQQPGQKAEEAPSTLSDADTSSRPDKGPEEDLTDEQWQQRGLQVLRSLGVDA